MLFFMEGYLDDSFFIGFPCQSRILYVKCLLIGRLEWTMPFKGQDPPDVDPNHKNGLRCDKTQEPSSYVELIERYVFLSLMGGLHRDLSCR